MPDRPSRDADARYDFSFGPDTPYAHAMALVDNWRTPDGEVVVDLGCGFGAIAEPTRALGLSYLGVDREPAGVESLEARGAEALVCDLSTTRRLFETVVAALHGRLVAAFTMLDSVEHLPNAAEVLGALCELARSSGAPPLVVSIPNVSHRDLATKLLLGRWDVTPTGLLDETHVRFFSPSTLDRQMRATGWEELDARDFPLELSDQHFPDDCVALVASTPIGALLRRIRDVAAPGATTNQFVRAYRPVATMTESPSTAPVSQAPFLSVVVRGDGPGGTAVGAPGGASGGAPGSTMAALDAQDQRDFEVLWLGGRDIPSPHEALEHTSADLRQRVRVVEDHGASPSALLDGAICDAKGRYVAVLSSGDRPDAHWVGALFSTAARHPGHVLRAGIARSGARSGCNLVDLVATGPGPLGAYALPRSVFSDMGLRFSSPSVAVAVAEWHVLVRAVELCGLAPAEQTELRIVATRGNDVEKLAALCATLDQGPLVLDLGAASALATLHARIAELERAYADAEHRLADLQASTSWRVTAPLRSAISRYRGG